MDWLRAIWERLNQPLLSGEAQWWVDIAAFVFAVLLPFILLLLNTIRRRKEAQAVRLPNQPVHLHSPRLANSEQANDFEVEVSHQQ